MMTSNSMDPLDVEKDDLDSGIGSVPEARELSILRIATIVLRWRRWSLGVPAALVLATSTYVLLSPAKYTAVGSFVPGIQGSSAQSPLSNVAAQFGINVQSGTGETPDFYAALIKTHTLLRAVAESQYVAPRGAPGQSGTLGDVLAENGSTSSQRTENAMKDLQKKILTVSADAVSGIVQVKVETRWPSLSAAIAQQVLSQVTAFDLRTQQSQAAAQAAFVESQTMQAKGRLRDAENRLEDFLQRNRQYASDPALSFQYQRLTRDLGIEEQLYTSLVQGLEQASMDAVRNTPTISVVEPPVAPVQPDSRLFVLKVIAALVIGSLLGIILALALEAASVARRVSESDVAAFHSAWHATVEAIRHPVATTRHVLARRTR